MIFKNNKGQSVVEAVLLLVILVSLMTFVTSQLKENEVASKFIEGPWAHLDGMIRHGDWANKEDAAENDPNLNERHGSPQQ